MCRLNWCYYTKLIEKSWELFKIYLLLNAVLLYTYLSLTLHSYVVAGCCNKSNVDVTKQCGYFLWYWMDVFGLTWQAVKLVTIMCIAHVLICTVIINSFPCCCYSECILVVTAAASDVFRLLVDSLLSWWDGKDAVVWLPDDLLKVVYCSARSEVRVPRRF